MHQIGDIAARAGVPASTIRYYEKEGVLPRAQRVNGRRAFDDDVVTALAVVGVAKQAGFTLEEIKTLLHGFSTLIALGNQHNSKRNFD